MHQIVKHTFKHKLPNNFDVFFFFCISEEKAAAEIKDAKNGEYCYRFCQEEQCCWYFLVV